MALQERDHNAHSVQITHVPSPVIDLTKHTGPTFAAIQKVQEPAVACTTASNPKKRKSDAQDDIKAVMFPEDVELPDDDDPRLAYSYTDSCGQTRQKMRKWIASGAMKVGEFQHELGVSGPGYNRFMNMTGARGGEGSDTYWAAVKFFKKRELAGLPLQVPKAKRPKTAAEKKQAEAKTKGKTTDIEAQVDTAGITLQGEDDGTVPIYMTCNDVRKGLRAHLNKGLTQAALCRALGAQLPKDGSKSTISAANFRYFMGQNGVKGGQQTLAFYAGYCLLEKLRIKSGKPKSDWREEMEIAWGPAGFDRSNPNQSYFVFGDEKIYTDEFGKVGFARVRGS